MHRKGTVLPRPYPYLMFWGCSERKTAGSPRQAREDQGWCVAEGWLLLSRQRLQRLGRRAACKCTRCACRCHFPGISWLRLSFLFPSFSTHRLQLLNVLGFLLSPLARLACAVLGLLSAFPAPSPACRGPAAGGRARRGAAENWAAAGRRRGAGAGAATRSPRGHG